MADSLKDLVELLSKGGPADAARAASEGFGKGFSAQQADKEARRKRLMEEVSRLSGSEANQIVGQPLFNPERSLEQSTLGALSNLRGQIQQPRGGLSPADEAMLAERKRQFDTELEFKKEQEIRRERSEARKERETREQPIRNTLSKATRDLTEADADAQKALAAIQKIEDAASALPAFKPGILNQAVARGEAAVKEFSKDPAITFYRGAVAQELSPLARKLAEEKGPLTDRDIDRIEKGLGDITTPLETRKALLDELRNKVALAVETRKQNAAKLRSELGMESLPPEPQQPVAPDLSTASDEDLFRMLAGGK